VNYTYVVAGTTRIGSVITPGRYWSNQSAQDAMLKYPQGSRPLVFYSPDDPSRTLLVPGLHFQNFWIFFVGLFVITFTLPFGMAGIFAIPAEDGNSLTFSDDSPWGMLMLIFLLASFAELFVLFLLGWLS
jgi:hypothetical protein